MFYAKFVSVSFYNSGHLANHDELIARRAGAQQSMVQQVRRKKKLIRARRPKLPSKTLKVTVGDKILNTIVAADIINAQIV
jgi:hypothetical protein